MRSMISILVFVLVLGSTTSAFARHGRWGGGHGSWFGRGFSRGYYGGGYNNYYRNSYYGYGNRYAGPTIMVVNGGSYYTQPYQSYAPTTIQTFGGGRGMALSPATGFVGNGGPFVIVR